MASSLVIIGTVPSVDLEQITVYAGEHDIAVEVKVSAEEVGKSLTDVALGYISYLPCTQDSILNLFSNLPIGASEHFPFFQNLQDTEYPKFLNEYPISGVFETPINSVCLRNIFSTILFHEKLSEQYRGIVTEAIKYRKQKHQLIKLSTALSMHYELDTLLALILSESCDIMNTDAGSIYIRERAGPGRSFTNKLRFKVSINQSIDFKAPGEFSIDIDKNRIAGYVAATGRPLNIRDVYALDDSVPYTFTKDFDEQFHYRMKSMLTVPLKNVEGEVVGVLQLLNKKRDASVKLTSPEIVAEEVISFSYADEEFLQSIGALAAVSIERTQLHENIEHIFEGFLSSSIAAIDERDRVTSGHSRRVMGYAMAFVEAINKTSGGVFAEVSFSESRRRQFKFAALLHDIGKIGVPEALLNKESRLSSGDFAAVVSRFEIIRFQLVAGNAKYPLPWDTLEELEIDRSFLEKVNKSGFLSDDDFQHLDKLRNKVYWNSYGEEVPFLSEEEWESLSVRKGNLTPKEREIINSHSISSQRILSKIPWTHELEKRPLIAAHHHEKLDGTGYPDGLYNQDMRLEDKILTVVDIYDAIVAQDRPYKPAMPPSKAIEILKAEARIGHVDDAVVNFFIEKEVYKIFL